mgnify:CR=1 FL=1
MDNKVTFEEDIIIFKEREEQSAPEYDPTKYIFTEEGTKSDMELAKGAPLATRKIFGLVRPGAGLDILENGVLVLNLGFGFTVDPITKKLILSAEIVPLAGDNIRITTGVEGEYTISVVGERELEPTSTKVPTSKAVADYTKSKTGNVNNIIPAITEGVNNNLTNAVNALYTQSHYLHTQITPQATWVINHPLKKKPSVTIATEDNITVFGEVEYPSLNQVIVRFSAGFSGSAFLN